MNRCETCGRCVCWTGNSCVSEGSAGCWRARAARLQAERDEAVEMLRRCDRALFDHVDRHGVRFAVDDFLARIDAKGKP